MMVQMNREFHYYVVYYLALKAGFSQADSETIALSSQMVDDAKLPWKIVSDEKASIGTPSKQNSTKDKAFIELTEVTQNYLFWDQNIARDVYLPFHFVPGEASVIASRRVDRKENPLAVSPDSDNARALLIEALRSENTYRIGIALHAYADTWAHQNFTGTIDGFNAIESERTPLKLAASALPPVGHLQLGTTPDQPQLLWEDPRLNEPYRNIRNSERFLEAARMIYRFLRTSRRASFEDEAFVLEPLRELWENRRPKPRDKLAIASDYVIYFDVPAYEPDRWFKGFGAQDFNTSELLSAFSSEGFTNNWRVTPLRQSMTRGEITLSNYQNSPFERWNSAVRAHRQVFANLMHKKGIRIV